ncbi:hypothetical protein OROGR_005761 [Orobanche gracilis]
MQRSLWLDVLLSSLVSAAVLDMIVFDGAVSRRVKRFFLGGALHKFGTDLTMLAEMGKLDMAMGREKEMEEIIEALLKRQKSNACLVGEAGVGKTAIVEGLAIKIAQRSVPPQLIGKKIIAIDLNRLIAGTMFRGMFEERMRDLIDEARASKGSKILFIDELHILVKNDHRCADASSILKPALARGDFVCIGATTLEEYTRHIQKDGALKRRFVPVHVCEPSRDQAIVMLDGLMDKYQTHHGITYTKSALISAVDLSKLYIREFLLPDKAIDLIDRAGARARVLGKDYVTEAEIEHVVSKSTGIPVTKVSINESQRLLQVEDTLKRSLIGQDEAVAAVCSSILRARVGIRDETKPIGCFLFTGPTGVGKTEMAKVLAKEYFGSEEAMVRLDMSEFMDYRSVMRLIGSPPGYHCHDDGGQLTEAVRRRPHSLVLFDEIEKAHEKVLDLLLQILDDGRLTDGKGKTADFTNTIVILTSNVGSNNFDTNDVSSNLRGAFKPELLNRFDQVVVFNPLEKEHIEKILEISINEFRARVAAKKNVEVEISKRLKEKLIAEGYDERYGARAMKRAIASLVGDKLAKEILNGSVAQHQTVIMDVDPTGKVVCQTIIVPVKINKELNAYPDAVEDSKSYIIMRCGSGYEYRYDFDPPDGLAQVLSF